MPPKVVCIVGPTGCGKTGLGVALAERLGGEVVSCDSMQLYRGMVIGTAAPTEAETRGVPHHMVGVIDPREDYSVARYAADAAECVDGILARGKLPILVGGTGLYLDALLRGHGYAPGTTGGETRRLLERRWDNEGGEALFAELRSIDPESAAVLHPNDKKRVIRALEVYRETGKTMSRHNADTRLVPPRYEPVYLGLAYADREEMKRIIDSGEIGKPLLIKCCHRNVAQGPGFKTENGVTNVAIHELDICRWLLGDEYEDVQCVKVRQSSNSNKGYDNPQVMLMRTKNGCFIDVEVQVADGYGYDIQCEVVCENGTVKLPDPYAVVRRSRPAGWDSVQPAESMPIMTDWKERFIEAYDIEFCKWVESVHAGKLTGPSAWDGYVACVAGDALNASRGTSQFLKVETMEKPEMYK